MHLHVSYTIKKNRKKKHRNMTQKSEANV